MLERPRLRRSVGRALVVAVAIGLSLPASGAAGVRGAAGPAGAGAAGGLPKLLADGQVQYEVRPSSIYYTGDGSGVIGVLSKGPEEAGPTRGFLRWSVWNSGRAVGHGTLWLKLGSPVATSPFTRFTVSVLAKRPRDGFFTRLTLHYRFQGRAVTDKRCLRDSPPARSLEWEVVIHGRCE